MTPDTHRERLTELIHGETDGTNSAADSAELRERLAADPAARAEFESMQRLNEGLGRVPAAEPPSHLFHRIIDAIPFGRAPWSGRHSGAHAHADAGGIGTWLAGLLPRPRMRVLATFATGLVCGALLLWVAVDGRGVDQSLDISHVYGTMRAIEANDGFEVIGTAGIDADRVHGEIRLHESDRKLLAEISLDAAEDIEWVLTYGAADVDFEGYRQVAGNTARVELAGGTMTVKGAGRYLLFFTERSVPLQPMRIEIFSSGNLLYQKDLRRN